MSPKSRGRKRPKKPNRRGQNSRDARRALPRQLLDTMFTAGAQITAPGTTALDAEAVASSVLGVWWGKDLVDADVDDVLGQGLVEYAARKATPEALAVLLAVAAVGPPRQAITAATEAARLRQLGVASPAWADAIGKVECTGSYASRDACGDASSVVLTFAYPGEPRHALVVLIDHNLGDIAKEVWYAAAGDEVVRRWKDGADADAELTFEELDPAHAAALVEGAFAKTDRTFAPPVGEEFAETRALALARLRALPSGDGIDPFPTKEWTQQERDDLVADFLRSTESSTLPPSDATEFCAGYIVDHGCDYDRGQPLRVSPVKVERFLMDWLPRKALLEPEDKALMPDVLAAWVRWAAGRTGLPSSAVERTSAAVATYGPQFAQNYDDPSRWGPARQLAGRMDLAGMASGDERRGFAVPDVHGEWEDFDLDLIDPEDEDERAILIQAAHPEYAAMIRDAGYDDVEVAGVNPRLHFALHGAVANQLWNNEPPEVWRTAQRLVAMGYDWHNTHHALMHALTGQIFQVLRKEQEFDREAFVAALDALPESWEADSGDEP